MLSLTANLLYNILILLFELKAQYYMNFDNVNVNQTYKIKNL